jgi:tetrapyrrole methylase family protein / MazG family protein
LIAQIYSRAVATEVKLTLMAVYPDHHEVVLVHGAGTSQAKVERLPLYQIDQSEHTGLLTCLYIPSLGEATSFESFQEIVAHLRAPEGCPWDREQTHLSLRPFLLEEAYEVLTAIDSEDPESILEELGDLLLQVVLHAQIASESGEFAMADILREIHKKLVRRHPHVFGDLKIEDAEHVIENWEKLKLAEKEQSGEKPGSVLDDVSLDLPALFQSEAYQRRAASVGFQWETVESVWEKLTEELKEIQQAISEPEREIEIGDLLFAVVSLSHWMGIDAESALRQANARFRIRFMEMEEIVRKEGRQLSEISKEELVKLWGLAKKMS